MYPFAQSDGVVPISDGAGDVEAIGPRVTRFNKGDQVVTTFNQAHLAGSLTPAMNETGTGGAVDGALTQVSLDILLAQDILGLLTRESSVVCRV